MEDPIATLNESAQSLDWWVARYKMGEPDPRRREHIEIMVQTKIFEFDLTVQGLASLFIDNEGFALAASMKGKVLALFEYVKVLERLVRKAQAMEKAYGGSLRLDGYRAARRDLAESLAVINAWSPLRSKAIGHYDESIADQVRLVEVLDFDAVQAAMRGLLTVKAEFLAALSEWGDAFPPAAGAWDFTVASGGRIVPKL